MFVRLRLLLFGMIMLAACGSDAATQSAPALSTSTVAPLSSTLVPSTEGLSITPVPPPDFTRFIAAVDAALAETSYAGAALTDPEIFIATGQLFCELLDDGVTSDEILAEHLDALASVTTGQLTDADATASGVVLGASTELICPRHGG